MGLIGIDFGMLSLLDLLGLACALCGQMSMQHPIQDDGPLFRGLLGDVKNRVTLATLGFEMMEKCAETLGKIGMFKIFSKTGRVRRQMIWDTRAA